MIKKVLIANRGEIALRIIRTCAELGIKTVALCPQPGMEDNFLETKLADEFYFLERDGASGYLDEKRVIEIAKKSGADAIHPGYGFLAENWRFARLCQKNHIKFIGPHFKTLKKFEDKIEAKKVARKLGIPILPSSDGPIRSKKDLVKWIQKIKSPFILKAQKGGGGIGLRVVNGEINFGDIFSTCLGLKKQIGMAFSETDFFLEKYLEKVRHIEFQILGDGKNVLHLGERECTIQRRNQKLFEEAPSTFLKKEERERVGALAVNLGKALNYQGAGTVEFLFDKDRNFYFLEVNPRIQVEHPVTEAITDIDIVEQQIRVAQGEELSFSQNDISFNGWAVEARINAESPEENFKPQTGLINKYLSPGGHGIFLHSFCQQGQEVEPYFDSLLAKLIAFGKNREEAISRLSRALDEYIIEGVSTTIPFFKVLLRDKNFLQGDFSTDFIEKSGILQKIKKTEGLAMKRVEKTAQAVLDEEEIAKLVFEIYQNFKKKEKNEQDKKISSNWVMSERLKMFED